MPAQKIQPEIRWESHRSKKSWYTFVNTDFVMEQNRVNSEEAASPGYQLVNAGLGYTFHTQKATIQIHLAANNLLNQAYYDHMSRFKNFGLLNMGRDIMAGVNISFNHLLKNKPK